MLLYRDDRYRNSPGDIESPGESEALLSPFLGEAGTRESYISKVEIWVQIR
ncbi:hypothetical protein [Gaoshiqia sediminis]|uniref:Uncharacterized protein n=1 Tax=Gaoshiqia sediminis TaxID=2986998 RepID=A0AA42C6T5_9BACT|nr:hypothetical protein [Gaoshiqia sediminis]MCW0482869.1 hypothetical protein [Gaoshiqia sediminis]